jgi:tetratricopeptide (TPR) repeat protein
MREGDILVSRQGEGFGLSKVLRITDFGDGTRVVHVRMYRTMPHRPTLADVDSAPVLTMHAPIDGRGLEANSEVIGNVPVERAELEGYLEYLKHTNFEAYANERGTPIDVLIARAQAAYEAGYALSEEKQYAEAIEKYSEAIAEVPFFFEAHDNRAFALMDLGRFREAAAGFAQSLQVEPDNPIASFALGECHLELGSIDEAIRLFSECVSRWPDEPRHLEFLARAEALRDSARATRKPS